MVVWLVHYYKHTLRTFFPDKTTSWMSGHFNGMGKRTIQILLMPRLQLKHSSLGINAKTLELNNFVAFWNRVNVSLEKDITEIMAWLYEMKIHIHLIVES